MEHKEILVVDDDPDILKVISEICRSLKFDNMSIQVDQADDGGKAIDKLKNKKFDLVFLDLRLPKADGTTIVKETREKFELNKKTPIIIVSGYFDEIDISSTTKTYEKIRLIEKPFDALDISRTAKLWLHKPEHDVADDQADRFGR